MVKEALGFGLDYYPLVRYAMGAYVDCLFLLMAAFLPKKKVCFDTRFGLAPRGPFERFEQARQVGAEISARRIPLADMPYFCHACYSQFCDHTMEGLEEV